MLQMKTIGSLVAGIAFIAILTVGAEYAFRCHGAPLTRDEAVARAKAQLKRYKQSFQIAEPMSLSDITTEQGTKTWLASFVGPKCKVIIVVDRCHGDSAESANACGR